MSKQEQLGKEIAEIEVQIEELYKARDEKMAQYRDTFNTQN